MTKSTRVLSSTGVNVHVLVRCYSGPSTARTCTCSGRFGVTWHVAAPRSCGELRPYSLLRDPLEQSKLTRKLWKRITKSYTHCNAPKPSNISSCSGRASPPHKMAPMSIKPSARSYAAYRRPARPRNGTGVRRQAPPSRIAALYPPVACPAATPGWPAP